MVSADAGPSRDLPLALVVSALGHGAAMALLGESAVGHPPLPPQRGLSVSWTAAALAEAPPPVPQPRRMPTSRASREPIVPALVTATAASVRSAESATPDALRPGPEAGDVSSAPAAARPAVTSPRFEAAAYLANPPPAYPPASRALGEQGTVLLAVDVSAAGEPEQVGLHAGSGYARLDRAALDAVRAWRFVPARRGDAAVAARVIVPIAFSLHR